MISVVIPIYNVEKYLRECLDSVRGQTFADFEVVMVNDGSTDSSRAIAAEYAASDPRFRLIDKPNGGPSETRNKGMENCRGEYFVFLDSDDALHPKALEILKKVLDDFPQADMAMTDIRQTVNPEFNISEPFTIKNGADLLTQTLYQKRGTHNNMTGRLIRRNAVEQTGSFRPHVLYEDLEYCQRLYMRCRHIAVSGSIITHYRITPGSLTRKWSPKRLDALDVTDEIARRMAADPKGLKAAQSRRFSAHYNMFLLSVANGYAPGADRCWPVIRQYRLQMLLDPDVRLKNKAGALIACFGRRFTGLFAKKFAGE